MNSYETDLVIEACHVAMDRGHQMVLDDLTMHPTRSVEHYALVAASCIHSSPTPNASKYMLARLGESSTMAGRSASTPADLFSSIATGCAGGMRQGA